MWFYSQDLIILIVLPGLASKVLWKETLFVDLLESEQKLWIPSQLCPREVCTPTTRENGEAASNWQQEF